MSYFDHVRCHACRGSLDPEEIGPQGMACPKCGVQLSLTDLFGVKASFAEDDLPELGLDDLMGKVAQPGADYRPPPPPPKKPRETAAQPAKPAPTTAGKGPIRPTVIRAASPAPVPTPAPPPAPAAPSEAPRVRSIGLSSPGSPPPRPQPMAKASDAALVPAGAPVPPAESAPPPIHRRIPGQSSAADVMRALKKKR